MRKILALFFLFGIVFSAQAQFGIRAGLSSANFSETNYKANVGFHGGVYYRLGTPMLEVEPGIQFAQKGFETNNPVNGDVITESLNYVDFPLLVRLNFLPALNVFAGPQVSVLVSRKREESGDIQTATDPIKGYDFGGVVGISAYVTEKINFQLSYDIGLSSLNYYDTDVKNRVLKLSLGYDIYRKY
ncbi:porin family protein [Algoriphagus limi]|uniref:PorT family protein n=1 Tax=Algoriphagus limi TaxID=2975273 RepID=A0ABT2GAG6_9BACT|nr:porin family protein [Algoriphagus limi]MCS5491753.1 PorT family protein [Algoriphagus limi]